MWLSWNQCDQFIFSDLVSIFRFSGLDAKTAIDRAEGSLYLGAARYHLLRGEGHG